MSMCWLQIPRVALCVQELHATAEAILFAGRAAHDVDGSVLLEERDAAESINRDLCSSNKQHEVMMAPQQTGNVTFYVFLVTFVYYLIFHGQQSNAVHSKGPGCPFEVGHRQTPRSWTALLQPLWK